MSMTEYLLAVFATLQTLTAAVIGCVFFYTYGRSDQKLSLYLALDRMGLAVMGLTLMLIRWEYGLPCLPQSIARMRLTGVVIGAVLVSFTSVQIFRLLRLAR